MIFFKKLFVLFFILFLCSCAAKTTGKKTFISEDADIFLKKISKINSSKIPLSGIGQLSLNNNGRINKFKIAFASDCEKKIRLEILSPAGLPAVSIAYDGDKLYFRENNGSKTRTFSNYKKVIKKITGVSPDIEVIAFLFCKKIPLINFTNADLITDKNTDILHIFSNNQHQTINLKKEGGFISVISYPQDKFIINMEKNGNFELLSETTGNKICFYGSSYSSLKNEVLKNIFILTR
ncbi:MAG: hypothetical protein RBR08_05745 [Desulforegulaceae bacterium]|nr:hypothetical protein [Desulforegulaceae bacterium]